MRGRGKRRGFGGTSRDNMTSFFELSPCRPENEPDEGPNRTHDGECDANNDSEPVVWRVSTVGS